MMTSRHGGLNLDLHIKNSTNGCVGLLGFFSSPVSPVLSRITVIIHYVFWEIINW